LVEAERFAWLLPFAVTLMPAGLALFWATATGVAACAWRPGVSRVLVLALTLSAAEWMRGHILTGFPWNVLGCALTSPLPLMQSAGIFGIYGLTLLAVIVFAIPLVAFADQGSNHTRWRAAALATLAALMPLPIAWGYGAIRLAEPAPPVIEGVRLRLVQPSVPQREKWRPENQREIFFDHLAMSRQAPNGSDVGLAGITHVIWPEAAMPFLPLGSPDAMRLIGDLLPDETRLISGALRLDEQSSAEPSGRRVFNSLIVFGPDGKPESIYDKIHLVPFGEYLPLQPWLEAIGLQKMAAWRGGFSTGQSPRPLLKSPGLPPVAALICYEAIFPATVVQGADRPQALINLTNDGWFGNTTGPRQHFHQARVRAVEEGLALIRVANNGITGVVDGNGRVLAQIGLNERGVIDTSLPGPRPPAIYALYGDWIFLISWLTVLVCVLFRLRQHSFKSCC
jgi:apolipoprotein N-acyltransferase